MPESSDLDNIIDTILESGLSQDIIRQISTELTYDELKTLREILENTIDKCRDIFGDDRIDENGYISATDEELDALEKQVEALNLATEAVDTVIDERLAIKIALKPETAVQIFIQYYGQDEDGEDRINFLLRRLEKDTLLSLLNIIRGEINHENDTLERAGKMSAKEKQEKSKRKIMLLKIRSMIQAMHKEKNKRPSIRLP